MIKEHITLVLGAGASFPYGFPLGTKLMISVINKLNNSNPGYDSSLASILGRLGFDAQMQKKFIQELRGAKQPSIDAFLQERGEEFLALGKAAIAGALIPYEDLENLLAMEHEFSANHDNERWYAYLLNLLGTYRDFRENNLSIITFNYDRSLEYFLFHTMKSRFSLNDEKAAELLSTIPIVHVYGQLGKLDFQDPTQGRSYTSQLTVEAVKKCVDEIHLIYEPRDEDEFTRSNEATYRLLKKTNHLVFLGFGYHEKNLERLMLSKHFRGRQIAATFYGRKAGEKERDDQLIHKYVGRDYVSRPFDYTILQFLQNTNLLT